MEKSYPEVTLTEEGILVVELGRYARITVALQEEILQKHRRLAPGRKTPILLKGDHLLSVDNDAPPNTTSAEILELTAAIACIAKTPLEKHLGQMYLWFSEPPYPFKLFTKEEEALQWLQQFIDEDE
ncbi:MAG: hypothetical protein ACC641_07535 [Acidiferrobacterales bacterium]